MTPLPSFPDTRPPTLRERAHRWLFGVYPPSYVAARIAASDGYQRRLDEWLSTHTKP